MKKDNRKALIVIYSILVILNIYLVISYAMQREIFISILWSITAILNTTVLIMRIKDKEQNVKEGE